MSIGGPGAAGADAFVIARSGTLDLRNAGELRNAILEALGGHRPVTVDLTRVTSVDAGVVQVLLAARRSAAEAGRRFFILAGTPSALPDVVSRLGIPPIHA